MYLSHYKLTEKPFQISTDPKFLWLGEKHREALAVLKYGIINSQGFVLLTGDVGTGKTTLINALVNSLEADTIVAVVSDPKLDKLEFFNLIASSFKVKKTYKDKFEFMTHFTHFLKKAYEHNKKILLIIDESQNITVDLLEEIRLLSNIEIPERKLLNIFFVGQNEFNSTLMRAQCRALRQRITITYSIEPLTESETGEYIKHRLRIAGSENEIFNKKAIRKIYSFTRGFPRLINIICDQALLSGYVKDIQIITPAIIRECLKELSLPGEFNPGKTQQPESAMKRRGVRGAKTFRYASLFLLVVLFGYFLSTTHYHGYIKHLKKYTAILSESSAPPITEEQPRQSVKQDHNRIARSQISHQSEKTELSLEAPSASVSDDAHSVPTKPSGGLNAVETSFSPKDRNLIIPFNYKSNEMPENAYKSLDRFAEIMLRNSDVQISIKGYTDALGSHEYNKRLSSFRANIVKSYLVGKGISPTRIKSIGIGEKNPLKPNTSAEGRRANRRVEIELIADNSKD